MHARDKSGWTCLHILTQGIRVCNQREISSLLYLINSGADVLAVDNAGKSVSDYAYSRNDNDKSCDLDGYRGDLWDLALARCGYDIYEMREKHPHAPRYRRRYSRCGFEMLWNGFEDLCPYYHDTPVWPPGAEPVEDEEDISDERTLDDHIIDYDLLQEITDEDISDEDDDSSEQDGEDTLEQKGAIVEQNHS